MAYRYAGSHFDKVDTSNRTNGGWLASDWSVATHGAIEIQTNAADGSPQRWSGQPVMWVKGGDAAEATTWTTLPPYDSWTTSSTGIGSGHVAVRFKKLPSGTIGFYRIYSLLMAENFAFLGISSAGVLQTKAHSLESWTSTGVTLSTDVWYVVTYLFDASTTTWSLKVKVWRDGTQQGSEATATSAGRSATTLGRCGPYAEPGYGNQEFYIGDWSANKDDTEYNSDALKHGIFTVPMVPAADGTHNTSDAFYSNGSQYAASGVTTSYTRLDDWPPETDDSDYIAHYNSGPGTNPAATHYLEHTYADVTETDKAKSLMMTFAHDSIAALTSSNYYVKVAYTEDDWATSWQMERDESFGATPFYSGDINVDGAAHWAGDWTQANLNALETRIGYNTANSKNAHIGILIEPVYLYDGGVGQPTAADTPFRISGRGAGW